MVRSNDDEAGTVTQDDGTLEDSRDEEEEDSLGCRITRAVESNIKDGKEEWVIIRVPSSRLIHGGSKVCRGN